MQIVDSPVPLECAMDKGINFFPALTAWLSIFVRLRKNGYGFSLIYSLNRHILNLYHLIPETIDEIHAHKSNCRQFIGYPWHCIRGHWYFSSVRNVSHLWEECDHH